MNTSSSTSGGLPAGAAPSTDVEAEVAYLRREVRELRAAGHGVSGAEYQAQLRAARARSTVEVQGVGQVNLGAGTTVPVDDLSPQVRMAQRGQFGRRLAQELQQPQAPGVVAGAAARTALLRQYGRLLEQEAARDAEVGAQAQAAQQRGMALSHDFEDHLRREASAAQLRGWEADRASWEASIKARQAEGARLADAAAVAAIQAAVQAAVQR